MIITCIEIYQSPIKLKSPFVISLGAFNDAENIFVVIRTDTGISGFGECSPFMSINGESMRTCFVVAQYLGKGLMGLEPENIELCSQIMNRIIYGNSSIKSAFDIALYDIASQRAGMPLYAFLGGKNNKQLVTDYTVSIGNPAKMANDATQIKDNGFQFIKVKLGGTHEEDIERIRAIREAIGNDIPLRVDANQAWTRDTALPILRDLSSYHIQYCEEPIPRWDFMNLPKIRQQSPIPIMADESCCDHHDAKRLIDLGACDYLNIKLGKSGGLFNAKKIISFAEQSGMQLQVGGFLESRLGFTAAAHLALASEQILYCDFDTPMMFKEDPIMDGILYGEGGSVKIPELNGLGASVDEGYLEKLVKVVLK